MSTGLTESQILERFEAVRAELQAQPWFAAESWTCSVYPFTLAPPAGITLQLAKTHWFNQEHHGIHLESFLAFEASKQAHSFVTLHLLHTPTIPGTNIKRKLLAQAVVDRIRPTVADWPGYSFRAGAYGQQPFAKPLDGRSPDFAAELSHELIRLCQLVGPVVDQSLQSLGALAAPMEAR